MNHAGNFMSMKTPSLKTLAALVKSIKRDISDEFRAYDGDETPGILLTVGCDERGSWGYQTGDNSFTGGAYGFPHWAVVGVYRRGNSGELARDIQGQLAESMAA